MNQRVPPGYKRTEVGVIPQEWEVKQLGEIAQIISGGTPSTLNPDYWDGGIMWCTPSDITATSGKYLEATERTISQKGLQNSSTYLLPTGTLLLCSRATIGDVKIATRPTSTNQGFKSLVIDPDQADNEFVYYQVLTLKNKLIQLGVGSTFLEVLRKDVASLFIPLPPLPEQRAIAAALADVDSLLAALDRLIAKKRAIKAAAMRDLLTGRVRLSGFESSGRFKQTEVGLAPEEWEVIPIAELGKFKKGQGIKKDETDSNGNLACIRYGEIYTTYNFVVEKLFSRISNEMAMKSQAISCGDLLFTGSGETADEIGKCVAYLGNETAYAGGDIIILSPERGDSRFLGYLLNSKPVAKQKERLGQGDAVVHIRAENLGTVKISFPLTPEQAAIASALSGLDAEIATLERERAKMQSIKQGMMDDLLTGRVRLV